MRTIIDITEDQVKALDELSEIEQTSRTALIRQAIDRMLAEEVRRVESAGAAFGLWSYRSKKEKSGGEKISRRSRETSAAPMLEEMVPQASLLPTVEDRFVMTQPEPEASVNAEAGEENKTVPAESAAPVPPPVKETAMTTVDPLAAFFAGVKP